MKERFDLRADYLYNNTFDFKQNNNGLIDNARVLKAQPKGLLRWEIPVFVGGVGGRRGNGGEVEI